MKRKAYLHDWNYLATFTYDSRLFESEDLFRKKLTYTLQHFHSRRDWSYIAVWERGELGARLHLHALLNVPPGELVGKIYEERYYDKKAHKMATAYRNTFFDLRFGRSDFKAIGQNDVKRGNVLDYMLKYLQKSGERVIYSRGLPSELELPISDFDIIVEYESGGVQKAVISEDMLYLRDDVEIFE